MGILNRIARGSSLGRNYRRVWTAAAASNLGDGVFLTALPLLAVSVTHDPLALSSVTFGLTVPWLVFALLSGALVDRWDRMTVMRSVDLVRGLLTAGLAAVVISGATSIPVLVAFAIALGSAETLFDTASLALVPGLVGTDPERLTRANARLESATIVANGFAGPAAGAALFAIATALPVAIDSASFFASTLVLRSVSTQPTSAVRPASSNIRSEITAGLRWLVGQPLLMTLAVVVGVMNLALAAAGALLVLLVRDEAHARTAVYAVALTAASAGALAGNVLAERCAARVGPVRVLPTAVAVIAASLTAIGALPRAPVIVVGFALIGLAGGLWNVITVALRQRRIPDEMLGRVNSVYRLVAFGTMPLGALGGGALARVAGLRAPFLAGGALIALTIPGLASSPPPTDGLDAVVDGHQRRRAPLIARVRVWMVVSEARLILTCGLPGAGKTTIARQLAADRSALRLTKDEWMWALGSSPWDAPTQEKVERELWHLAQEVLRLGLSVVLDFGLWARIERDDMRSVARDLGVGVELHYLDVPTDELWRRIEARNSEPPWDSEPIRRAHLDEWATLFQPPDAAELALFDPPPDPN